jgi:hypothetical protein
MSEVRAYTEFYNGTDASALAQFQELTRVLSDLIQAARNAYQFELIPPTETTPSMKNKTNLRTTNLGTPTTITDFIDGYVGQKVTVVFEGDTTIDFSTGNLRGNGGVNWTPPINSFLTATWEGSVWLCQVTTV